MTLETQESQIANAQLESLLGSLDNDSPVKREQAREGLVALGSESVAPLIRRLSDRREHVRWEAAKALEQIADPLSATPLAEALGDESVHVRWVIAEGLIALRHEGVIATLAMLMTHSNSIWVRDGAHHVLSECLVDECRPVLRPVIEALEGFEPAIITPPAALTALRSLREDESAATPTGGSSPRKPR
jgi:HEAT repeat protein